MASPINRIKNFCNKIKAYHAKRGEEQFYDFTIKDKDGKEIKSHKFLLASQIEYFAALFRRDPTASETTFKDFSLDVINNCIDYIYIHEISLTSKNVQDVLVFADFINLTEVIDICTDFIIKSIDHSNCGHVINFGNAHGMEKLVEAGVFFALKNLKVGIISLDKFTKGVISKKVDSLRILQQERVTIMEKEQWHINRLKKFLTAPEEEIDFQVRCSSVYSGKSSYWGPRFAINGEMSVNSKYFFHSELENNPWLEVKLPSPVLVSSVTIVNRLNGYQERLRNLEVRAGMEPVPEGFTAHDRGRRKEVTE
ncbi:kelch-like protein 17 [Oculina patagonica]